MNRSLIGKYFEPKKMTPRSVKNTRHKKNPVYLINKPSKSHFFFTPLEIPKPSEIERRAAASCKKTVGGYIFCLFYLVACAEFGPTEEANDMFQLNAGPLRTEGHKGF
jgi:hypothetical protein